MGLEKDVFPGDSGRGLGEELFLSRDGPTFEIDSLFLLHNGLWRGRRLFFVIAERQTRVALLSSWNPDAQYTGDPHEVTAPSFNFRNSARGRQIRIEDYIVTFLQKDDSRIHVAVGLFQGERNIIIRPHPHAHNPLALLASIRARAR